MFLPCASVSGVLQSLAGDAVSDKVLLSLVVVLLASVMNKVISDNKCFFVSQGVLLCLV